MGTLAAVSGTNRGTLTLNAGSGLLGGAVAGAGRVNVIATTPGLTSGIRPEMVGIDSSGIGLVTHDANGFRLLTSADATYFSPATAGAAYLGTATPRAVTAVAGIVSNAAATANAALSAAVGLHESTTLNSLNLTSGGRLTSTGGGVPVSASASTLFNSAGALNTLTLTSGAILAETGNTGIVGGAVTAAANSLYVHAPADLAISAYVLGSGRVIKDGAGTLTLSQRSLNTGAFDVLEGTVVLNAGANTILVTPTATVPGVRDLVVNGGTIDLNGNSQAVARLTHTTAANFSANAGVVTNTGSLATLTANSTVGANMFSGIISGALNFDKVGTNAYTLHAAATYSGATNVRGGTLQLQDAGAITGGGAINVNFATLSIVNSGLSHVAARTGASALNLSGATVSFAPRLEGETSATSGAVSLVRGSNTLTVAAQPGLGGSLNLSAGALSRTAGSGAVLTVSSATGQIGRGTAAAGGQSAQVTFTSGATLTNNILGGWATNGVDFLTYLSAASTTGALGVGVLGDTGSGFADWNNNNTSAGDLPDTAAASNVRSSGNANTNVTGARSFNSLTWASAANGNNIVYTGLFSDGLTLASGGLVRSGNFTGSIGATVDYGRITQGSGELFIHNNQNTLTINARITGTNRAVFSSLSGGTTVLANGGTRLVMPAVTATGSDITLSASAPASLVVGMNVSGPGVPADTTVTAISGATVTLSAAPTLAAGAQFLTFGNASGGLPNR
jgi:autotransporter-associated beta strand protein